MPGPFTTSDFDNANLQGAPVYTETQNSVQTFWIGRAAKGRVPVPGYSARLTGSYAPTATGPHLVGIHSAGLSRVPVDGPAGGRCVCGVEKGPHLL